MSENFLITSYRKKAVVCKKVAPASMRPSVLTNTESAWNWPQLLPGESVVRQADTHLSLLGGPHLYLMSKFKGPNGHMPCAVSIVMDTLQLNDDVTLYSVSHNKMHVNWTTSAVLLDLELVGAQNVLPGKYRKEITFPNVTVCQGSLYYISEKEQQVNLTKVSGFEALLGIERDEDIPKPMPWRFEHIPNFFGKDTRQVVLKSSKKHLYCYDSKSRTMTRACGSQPANFARRKCFKVPSALNSAANPTDLLTFAPEYQKIVYLTHKVAAVKPVTLGDGDKAESGPISRESFTLTLCSDRSQKVKSIMHLTLSVNMGITDIQWPPCSAQLQIRDFSLKFHLVLVSLAHSADVGLAALKGSVLYPLGSVSSQGLDTAYPSLAVEERSHSIVLKKTHSSFACLRWNNH